MHKVNASLPILVIRLIGEYFHTYRNTWKSATDGFVSMAIDILESASLILPTKCNCMAYKRKASCEKIKWFLQQIHVGEFNYYILLWDNLVLSPGLINVNWPL